MKQRLVLATVFALFLAGVGPLVPAHAQMPGRGHMMQNNRDWQPGPGMMSMMTEHMMNRGGMMPGSMMGVGAGFRREKPLSNDEISRVIDGRLVMLGLARLKVGSVKDSGEDAAQVDVVTQKGELVARLKVDRETGRASVIE